MKQYTVHYQLRNGETGRKRFTAHDPWDAVLCFLNSKNLDFKDVAGILSKTA